jgi:branched-chain amino acid transport system substrate-binding protein
MTKNSLSVFILLLVAVLVLAGCTTTATPTPQAGSGTTPAAPAATTPADPGSAPAATTPAEPAAPPASGEPIKIGLYGPLTGPVAFLGEGFDMGIRLAIEDLGGEIEGRPIEFVTADNKCNPTDAVNAVSRLMDVDQVHAIIGGGCSSATMGALPIIQEGQTPAVSATSTTPFIYDLSGVGGNEWAFRINPDDLIMAQGYAEYIHDQGVNRISLVAENTDFGRGAMNAYKPIFDTLGVEISSEDYFDLGTSDFRSALTRLRTSTSEAVLIVMTENDCATFMRQYREVGVEAAVYSRGACTSPLFLQLTADDPSIAEGIVEFSFFYKHQDPELADRFEARWNTPITGHRMGGYYAMYYTLAPAIRSVIQSGQEVTRETIREALEQLNVETPAGLISFDDNNQAYTNGVLTVNRNGEVELLEIIELGPVDHSILGQ